MMTALTAIAVSRSFDPAGHAEATPPSASLTEAHCVPRFEGSVIDGYRCRDIRPGSRYAELGLRDGDVIRAIDGEVLADPVTALEKLGRLSAPNTKVSYRVERNGTEQVHTFDPEVAKKIR